MRFTEQDIRDRRVAERNEYHQWYNYDLGTDDLGTRFWAIVAKTPSNRWSLRIDQRKAQDRGATTWGDFGAFSQTLRDAELELSLAASRIPMSNETGAGGNV